VRPAADTVSLAPVGTPQWLQVQADTLAPIGRDTGLVTHFLPKTGRLTQTCLPFTEPPTQTLGLTPSPEVAIAVMCLLTGFA